LIKYWLAKSDIVLQSYRLLASLGFGRVANLVSKAKRDRIMNSFLSLDDVDWSRTRAYSRGVLGQIFVNLKGREPLGIVEPGDEYEQLCDEIISQLENLSHPTTGEPLISKVCRRGEIYHGPYVDQAADVVFAIQNHVYEASAKLGLESDDILGPSEYEDSGSHRSEGILVMAGSGIRRGHKIQNATVADVMPTLLALADLPIPPDLDGQPLYNALEEGQRARIRCAEEPRSEEGKSKAPVLKPDEKAMLEKRLRSLGYLGD
jgi:predicted AlkP superfamily phosphohydrolase/phosphomutase